MSALSSLHSPGLDPAREASSVIEGDELREAVARELARLSPGEREAVSAWAGVSGESCRSVARRYGVSPQTVSNWAAAAIERIRPKLEVYL
jgi:DNA-directed RNA polymerase specialized sigma24 family protein